MGTIRKQLNSMRDPIEILHFLSEIRKSDFGEKCLPVNVDLLCDILGINIQEKEFDDNGDDYDIVGKIIFEGDRTSIILDRSQNKNSDRKRFTIAHELGHYFLHREMTKEITDTVKTMNRTKSYWDNFEYQANDFAANLLMPRSYIFKESMALITQHKQHKRDEKMPQIYFINALAYKFGVSTQAMTYRLKNLGIIE